MTTRHYVELATLMRLREWSVRLTLYPGWGAVAPFAQWDATRPTQSLDWFHAYNATKHDREKQLHRASLENVIRALAALYVMLAAQVGPDVVAPGGPFAMPEFECVELPRFDPSEQYVPAFNGSRRLAPPTVVPKFVSPMS